MFDPFPTFPLPPTEDEVRAEAEQQRAEDLREYERDRYVGVLHALADHAADERRRNFEDAHYEGDPAPVIGWGESVKRNVSDYLRRREAIAAGEKDPGPGGAP